MDASRGTSEKVSKSWQDNKPIKNRMKYLLDHIEIIPTDVTFRVGSDEDSEDISAHRLILAIGSEVFHAMLYGDLRERDDIIRVPDVDPKAFRIIIEYLYTENVIGLSMDNVMDCLYGAKKYMVVNLTDHCRSFVFDNLRADMTDHLDEEDLHEFAAAVVCQYTVRALDSGGFLGLPQPLLRDLLCRDQLSGTENEIYQAALRWVLKRQSVDISMADAFAGIIECIRLPLLSLSELADGPCTDGALSLQSFNQLFRYQFGTLCKPSIPFSTVARSPSLKRFYGVIQLAVGHVNGEAAGSPAGCLLLGRLHVEVFVDLAPMCSSIFVDLLHDKLVIKYGYIRFNNMDDGAAAERDSLPNETSILPFDPYWISLELRLDQTGVPTYCLHISHHSGASVTDGIVFAKVVNGMEFLRRADAIAVASDEGWSDSLDDVWSGVLEKTNSRYVAIRRDGAMTDAVLTMEEYDEFIRQAIEYAA